MMNQSEISPLGHGSGHLIAAKETLVLPHYGKNLDGLPVELQTFCNADVMKCGAFLDGKLIDESCLLSQWKAIRKAGYDEKYRNNALEEFGKSNPAKSEFECGYYCINDWDRNYQHFIMETLPKIFIACSLNDAPVFVLDFSFIREIVSTVWPKASVVYISRDDPTRIRCNRLHVIPPIGHNFQALVDVQIFALKFLRNAVIYNSTANPSEEGIDVTENPIYVGRLDKRWISGSARENCNQEETLNLFKNYNVQIDDFNGKSLTRKCETVSRSKHHISPIGANLLNYIFATTEIDLYVIDHPYFSNLDFYSNLFAQVGSPVNYNVLSISKKADSDLDLPGDPNSPYGINCVQLEHELARICSK